MRSTEFNGLTITALGHSGFFVEESSLNLSICFDPYDIKDDIKADYLIISHDHFDHCDAAAIKKITKDSSVVIAAENCREELADIQQAKFMKPDQRYSDNRLTISAIGAYNIDKWRTPYELFHPKDYGGIAPIVEIKTPKPIKLLHLGDTDPVPDLWSAKDIDVLFVPISGTYVMTVEEAVETVKKLQPKIAIPMHFGKIIGSIADAERFQKSLSGSVEVKVLAR